MLKTVREPYHLSYPFFSMTELYIDLWIENRTLFQFFFWELFKSPDLKGTSYFQAESIIGVNMFFRNTGKSIIMQITHFYSIPSKLISWLRNINSMRNLLIDI